MDFSARIDGKTIHCEITADQNLTAPVFCFSGMAPMTATGGGEKVYGLGGYTEVQLPDLRAGAACRFQLALEDPSYRPTNRAWLPLGAYLRAGDQRIPLPALPAGVRMRPTPRPEGARPAALRLCPQPKHFAPAEGVVQAPCFTHRNPGHDSSQDSSSLRALDALCQRAGLGAFLGADGVALETGLDPDLPAEGYRLTLQPTHIRLEAAGEAGLFYGGITLATLRQTHAGALPCGVIEDAPRFEWRGQHLDCARHFYDVETILRLLDLMALMKINRFHWHFADDEAFRLEIKAFPSLSKTHFRGEGEMIPGVFGGGIRAGGSYSREDAQRVIDHARALHIEVMPEIEVPAHALTLARLFPETRDPLETGTEVSVQGYPGNVMNPAMPESWRVWETIAAEVAALFPFGVVHLGADELPPETWQGSPAARDLMQREGLKTSNDLLGWTLNRLAGFLSSNGFGVAAWDEASLGKVGIGHDALLFSWSGQGPGLVAARAGYRVVMTPGQHLYLDMAQTADTDDWGASWAAIIGLADTIAWDPVPDDEPELEAQILGVQSTFWGEFTTQDQEMEPMIAPRILGSAVMGWQARKSCDPQTLAGLADDYRPLFAAIGWQST